MFLEVHCRLRDPQKRKLNLSTNFNNVMGVISNKWDWDENGELHFIYVHCCSHLIHPILRRYGIKMLSTSTGEVIEPNIDSCPDHLSFALFSILNIVADSKR